MSFSCVSLMNTSKILDVLGGYFGFFFLFFRHDVFVKIKSPNETDELSTLMLTGIIISSLFLSNMKQKSSDLYPEVHLIYPELNKSHPYPSIHSKKEKKDQSSLISSTQILNSLVRTYSGDDFHFFLKFRNGPKLVKLLIYQKMKISKPFWLVWFSLVLWHINHCRLFNAKIPFIHMY